MGVQNLILKPWRLVSPYRCFAGTPEQMYDSLIGTLSKLPDDIKVSDMTFV